MGSNMNLSDIDPEDVPTTDDDSESTDEAGEAESLPDLSSNVFRDLVKYVRSNTVRNEQQFVLTVAGYASGYFTEMDHYISGVLIGTSSSGKTHLMNQVENLFPDKHMYMATTGSDKALIYDGDWDDAYIASLDELQKPSDVLIEFLKSVHGDDEQFVYKLTPDSAERREAEEAETITRTAKPYFFLFAQFDTDFEMWNRLMKIPVHESQSKNEMVGALSHDHYYIKAEGEDVEYGFDYEDGTRALQEHIRSIPEAIESGETPGRVFLPNGDPKAFDRSGVRCDASGGFEWDVYEVLRDIYNSTRSEVNRIYDMVTNAVRSSALLNYKNREVRHLDVPNHEAGDYLIAEPQDVANILFCREALLATTHELDDKKRTICNTIQRETGAGNEADMGTIVDGLGKTDMSMLNRSELRNHLEKLHENYLVEIKQGGSGSQDTYVFQGWDELGTAGVYQYEELFTDCFDPITGKPFFEAFEEQKDSFQDSAQELTDGASADITSNTGQETLGSRGAGLDVSLDRHEEAVRSAMKEALDGVRVRDMADVPVEGLVGLTDPNDPESNVSIDGTILDPTHGCWYQPDRPDDWVEEPKDARREVRQAVRSIIQQDVALYDEVHETDKEGRAVDVTFAVLGEQDL